MFAFYAARYEEIGGPFPYGKWLSLPQDSAANFLPPQCGIRNTYLHFINARKSIAATNSMLLLGVRGMSQHESTGENQDTIRRDFFDLSLKFKRITVNHIGMDRVSYQIENQ